MKIVVNGLWRESGTSEGAPTLSYDEIVAIAVLPGKPSGAVYSVTYRVHGGGWQRGGIWCRGSWSP